MRSVSPSYQKLRERVVAKAEVTAQARLTTINSLLKRYALASDVAGIQSLWSCVAPRVKKEYRANASYGFGFILAAALSGEGDFTGTVLPCYLHELGQYAGHLLGRGSYAGELYGLDTALCLLTGCKELEAQMVTAAVEYHGGENNPKVTTASARDSVVGAAMKRDKHLLILADYERVLATIQSPFVRCNCLLALSDAARDRGDTATADSLLLRVADESRALSVSDRQTQMMYLLTRDAFRREPGGVDGLLARLDLDGRPLEPIPHSFLVRARFRSGDRAGADWELASLRQTIIERVEPKWRLQGIAGLARTAAEIGCSDVVLEALLATRGSSALEVCKAFARQPEGWTPKIVAALEMLTQRHERQLR